jgi:hypothetical protein
MCPKIKKNGALKQRSSNILIRSQEKEIKD